jgi:hypothetical protein
MQVFIATFTNADTGLQARIAHFGKRFAISFWDLDTNSCACAGVLRDTIEAAYKCATSWAGVGVD